MADMPMLRNYLSVRFRDGLFREESRQLIKGTNANNELLGLVNTETHVPFDSASFQAALSGTGIAVADANYFDILDYARTQLRLNQYNGNQILVNPVAGFVFNHTVDSQGGYLMNGANWSMISQLMNESTYIDEDVFYVFDGQQSGTIYQRENVTVDFSYEDRDNFIKNLVTIRAEMREVFVVEQPNAVIRGTYSAATSTT
jgi:HK97 family phage major capsid protein